MSDVATQKNEVFEPDEDTLISALRNQDDIPILMDVVAEQVAARASQEDHLARALDNTSAEEVDPAVSEDFSQERIAKAIAGVLEKRLPELVSEVVEALYSSSSTCKKD